MHCNARLNLFSRKLLISRWQSGQKVGQIAEHLGVSRRCCYKWINRYKEEGLSGLEDKRSGPKRGKRIPPRREQAIIKARNRFREGPDRLALRLGLPRSTVYVVLRRNKLNHLFAKKVKEPVRRYEKKTPGELLHVDLKYLPSIGGKRYKYQLTIMDDCTRYSKATILEKKTTTAITKDLVGFLDEFPFPVERVMTDNGMEFTMRFAAHKDRKTYFQKELEKRGIKHLLIKPGRPQTNGKVERFHRTIDEELYRIKQFINESHRQRELNRYLYRYNNKRAHLGIRGITPTGKLNTFLDKKCYQV